MIRSMVAPDGVSTTSPELRRRCGRGHGCGGHGCGRIGRDGNQLLVMRPQPSHARKSFAALDHFGQSSPPHRHLFEQNTTRQLPHSAPPLSVRPSPPVVSRTRVRSPLRQSHPRPPSTCACSTAVKRRPIAPAPCAPPARDTPPAAAARAAPAVAPLIHHVLIASARSSAVIRFHAENQSAVALKLKLVLLSIDIKHTAAIS